MTSSPDVQEGRQSGQGEVTVDSSRMTIFEHLSELAARLKKSLIVFMIAFAAVSIVPDPLQPLGGPYALYGYNFLLVTLLRWAEIAYVGPDYKFYVKSVTDPISVFMDLSMVLALVISLPYIFNQLYGFVAPGLYQREKRAVRKYILPFTLLFAAGGIFGLVVVLPIVMRMLLSFFPAFGLANLVSLTDFINLLLMIPVITGLAFTFPVFLIPLVELKVLSVKQLSSTRKWVYVLVALAVGLVNPDPTFISSIPIIIPIYFLYEITVYISKRIERKRMKLAENGAAEIIPK